MPDFLRAIFIVRKRRDGRLDLYHSRKDGHATEATIIQEHGFASFDHLYAADSKHLEGYAAIQLRPPATMALGEQGEPIYLKPDYGAPFARWVLGLRHIAHELPDWVRVGEIKQRCVKVMPAWAALHLPARVDYIPPAIPDRLAGEMLNGPFNLPVD